MPSILVVDDDQFIAENLVEVLNLLNYDVAGVANSGKKAIDSAKILKPDIILMDIQMPTMDGLEATRRIRADAGLAAIPIIALTALAMPDDRERCLNAGANEYLSKPVSLKRLVEIIEAQLNILQET